MNRGLLATREQLSALRERISRRPFDTIGEVLAKRCALILAAKPIGETSWRTQHAQGRWAAALTAARACQGRIFDLIVAHHIDPNIAYRDRAIEEMKSLAVWSTWVDPCHPDLKADLCTAECCAAMAVGLDWLAEDLSEADRLRCTRALAEKGIAAYNAAVAANAWWYTCYHNWNAVLNGGCGLGALLLADENPDARQALDSARTGLKHFFAALGREGGWDEGVGYWAYALRYLLLFGEGLDHVQDDRSIFRQRGMEVTGQFGVYFCPRGHSASFGHSPAVPVFGALYGLAERYQIKEVCWWLDRYALHRDVSTTGWSDAGLSLLLRPKDMPPAPAPDLSPVKVFHEIGWAAVADQWPEPSMYAAVKAGDLSANHSHLNMNSIQVQVDGEMLLVDPGNPPSARSYNYGNRGRTSDETPGQWHNTLTVGERNHRIDARGQIVEAQSNETHRWITADGGTALGENVRFNRHLIMLLDPAGLSGHTLVVLDEVLNASPEKVEACWHSFAQVKLVNEDDGWSGAIVGKQSGLHFAVAATAKVDCSTLSNPQGKLTESVLRISTPSVSQLVLVSVFSRRPIGPVEVRRTSRGDIDLTLDAGTLRFKGSRKHAKLKEIELGSTEPGED